MRESNTHANAKSNIQCVEVLISKNCLNDHYNNLFWTLSVYSLENEPVKKNRALRNSEIFHFMVYDWNRTIRQLLDDNQVPYSIIQFFSPPDIYSTSSQANVSSPDSEIHFMLALDTMPEANNLPAKGGSTGLSVIPDQHNADLLHR